MVKEYYESKKNLVKNEEKNFFPQLPQNFADELLYNDYVVDILPPQNFKIKKTEVDVLEDSMDFLKILNDEDVDVVQIKPNFEEENDNLNSDSNVDFEKGDNIPSSFIGKEFCITQYKPLVKGNGENNLSLSPPEDLSYYIPLSLPLTKHQIKDFLFKSVSLPLISLSSTSSLSSSSSSSSIKCFDSPFSSSFSRHFYSSYSSSFTSSPYFFVSSFVLFGEDDDVCPPLENKDLSKKFLHLFSSFCEIIRISQLLQLLKGMQNLMKF
jgi:hypothetical protein